MVQTILKPNHWKSEKNGGHFVQISNGFGQIGHHFVPISNGFRQNGHHFVQNGTPLENQSLMENQTEGYHWNSEHVQYSSPHCSSLVFV